MSIPSCPKCGGVNSYNCNLCHGRFWVRYLHFPDFAAATRDFAENVRKGMTS